MAKFSVLKFFLLFKFQRKRTQPHFCITATFANLNGALDSVTI